MNYEKFFTVFLLKKPPQETSLLLLTKQKLCIKGESQKETKLQSTYNKEQDLFMQL